MNRLGLYPRGVGHHVCRAQVFKQMSRRWSPRLPGHASPGAKSSKPNVGPANALRWTSTSTAAARQTTHVLTPRESRKATRRGEARSVRTRGQPPRATIVQVADRAPRRKLARRSHAAAVAVSVSVAVDERRRPRSLPCGLHVSWADGRSSGQTSRSDGGRAASFTRSQPPHATMHLAHRTPRSVER